MSKLGESVGVTAGFVTAGGAGVCLRRGDGGRGRDDIKSPNGGDQSWVLTGTRVQGGGGLLMAPLFVTRYHTSQADTQTRGSCIENLIKK